MNPEIGYNFGANLSKAIRVGAKEVVFGLDYYYTYFQDQVVIDFDQDVQSVSIYNLSGKSFSHSAQAQIDVELFPFFDVRLAYRYNDVKTDFISGRLRKPPDLNNMVPVVEIVEEDSDNDGILDIDDKCTNCCKL